MLQIAEGNELHLQQAPQVNKTKENRIRKMAFLLSITSTLTQRGYRQVSRKTQRYAIRLMRRLRYPDNLHPHHATVAPASDGNDCDPTWVVDIGASRHFSTVSSEFVPLKLYNQVGTVNGIICKIEGSGSISFFVHGRLGKPLHTNFINVL